MHRKRTWAAGLFTLTAACLCGEGCGWTARDTYLARQTSIRPQPGDGSSLVLSTREDPFAAGRGTSVADAPQDR